MAGNSPQDLNGLGPLMAATGDGGHSDMAGTDDRAEKHTTSPASLQAVKNTSKRMEKMRQQPHVIMFNQSGMPTVVSSGVSGQLQHVSVVGHVQRLPGPSDGNTVVIGGESDELPSKKKATSFKITNVYLSRPPSNDGEDSCDDNEDLEDSHTEESDVKCFAVSYSFLASANNQDLFIKSATLDIAASGPLRHRRQPLVPAGDSRCS